MSRAAEMRVRFVDRFFQVSLFALLVTGYLALVGSGRLSLPVLALTSSVLVVRLCLILGWVTLAAAALRPTS